MVAKMVYNYRCSISVRSRLTRTVLVWERSVTLELATLTKTIYTFDISIIANELRDINNL